jgi:hypothetical protein
MPEKNQISKIDGLKYEIEHAKSERATLFDGSRQVATGAVERFQDGEVHFSPNKPQALPGLMARPILKVGNSETPLSHSRTELDQSDERIWYFTLTQQQEE